MEAINMYRTVPATAINRLLKRDLSKGIQVLCAISTRSLKLFQVGCLTKNCGGYARISLKGLNAVDTT